MLSSSIGARLDQARALENNYQPNQAVADTLSGKSLVMVVAPAATGKSYLMTKAVDKDPDNFSRVSGFVSRPQRDNDEPGMYQYFEHSDSGLLPILSEINSRYVVQYAVHPTTNFLYGSRIGDYRNKYNLIDMLSGAADHLRSLPFKKTYTIGLVADPGTWQKWLFERYPEANEERHKRVLEAISSLEWTLAQPESKILWLNNREGEIDITTERLIRQVKGEAGSDSEARGLAESCLELAKSLN